jgi:hypothetical protein
MARRNMANARPADDVPTERPDDSITNAINRVEAEAEAAEVTAAEATAAEAAAQSNYNQQQPVQQHQQQPMQQLQHAIAAIANLEAQLQQLRSLQANAVLFKLLLGF